MDFHQISQTSSTTPCSNIHEMKSILTALLLWCVPFAQGGARLAMTAHYSEAANVFQILDCTSQWWEDFCGDNGEYRKDWAKRFPITGEDLKYFAQYKRIREKYYRDPDQAEKDPRKNRNGLFSSLGALAADPIAERFYEVDTVPEALNRLRSVIHEDDRRFLVDFYAHFEKQISIYLRESLPLKAMAKQVGQSISQKKYGVFLDEILRFYKVTESVDYKVLFVWWPPLDRDFAVPVSRFLIMSENPVRHKDVSKVDIVFHEVVHTISARQPLEQKQGLTKAFLSICQPPSGVKKGKILEEPLAVAIGQMLFLDKFDRTKFEREKNWYRDDWVNQFAPSIFPFIRAEFKEGKTIADGFIDSAARACKEQLSAKK